MQAIKEAVNVKNLSYSYPHEREQVLSNISFDVKEGEVIGIAGPSGCGKSTLMLALSGLIPHSLGGKLKGSVELFGKDTTKQSLLEIVQQSQILFQSPDSQLFALSVEDEVTFGLENLALPWKQIEERTQDALIAAGIFDLRKSSPEELSSGQKQRVAFAAVLAMQPKVLLFDEPTANLDASSVKRLEKTVARLRKSRTIVVVEHNIEFLQRVADRIILMDKGKIVSQGTPQAVIKSAAYKKIMIQPARQDVVKRNISRIAETGGNEAVLVLKDIDFKYQNGHHALKDVSLSVGKGDFLGILGTNGSGKSTLALNIIGLLKGKGTITYKGEYLSDQDVAERVKHIGYVFQNPNYQLFEDTLAKEVAFGPQNLGLSKAEVRRRSQEALGVVNMQHLDKHDPHALSVGQKRRVSIASVLAMNPDILIIDEPDTGVDNKTARQLMNHIKDLNKNGKTIIMISHNIELLADYCTRIIAMEDGKIVPVKKVMKDYFG